MKFIKIIFTVCFFILTNTDVCSQSDLNTIINNHGLLDKKRNGPDQLKLSSEFKGYLVDRELDSIENDIVFLENYFTNQNYNIALIFNEISNFLIAENFYQKSCLFTEKAMLYVKSGKLIFKRKDSKSHLSILSKFSEFCSETNLSFNQEFNTWKGSHEQIDDVCVMGVRIT